ncbi:hypothetical protein FHR47_002306 [Xanthomonas arboricola]|uniref:hypothetical protein n=1 Tax=Xanthomonas cannabis TaxID=1885674 RepID=UPI00161C556D|nr:hypothetical protein [Xanthomonas cannabis]MBB3802058.1 hypothetical protein [Xanthomonas cannabis]
MGTEAVWIPAVLAAVGGTASYVDQKRQADKQDDILGAQIRQQSSRQDEADQAVNQLLADRSTSDASAERGNAASQYLQQVRAAQGAASGGLRQAGAVSDAYQQSSNDAALGIADYGANVAKLMARIDAPQQQRQREAIQSAQLGSDLGLIGRRASADDFLAKIKLQGVRSNPWLAAAGQAASGAAGAWRY